MLLITGGTGYIGAHTALELLKLNANILIIDNLKNSSENTIEQLYKITKKRVKFLKGDILDKEFLKQLFLEYKIEAVFHFAGLKAVGESTQQPLTYYDNNITGTLNILNAMACANVKKFIFSSSATVYGTPSKLPLTEEMPKGTPTNPYGRSKSIIEDILQDLSSSDNEWSIAILRYFNPAGAHESGLIGESPKGIPNNLMPYILKVANKKLEHLNIFGNDYKTIDGTGVRDYLHVVDLAIGHIKAHEFITKNNGAFIWNLGTGRGVSVLDMIQAFEKETGVKIPYKITERRPGDIDECWADCSKARCDLEWESKKDLTVMMADSWRWENNKKK